MFKNIYYQRDAADPVLEDSVVLSIVREYAPEAKQVVELDETGDEARMYAVDAGIFLKVQRPQQLRYSTSLEKEALFLKYLEKNCVASAPRVLGYGKRDAVEYICMTRIPGIALKDADLTRTQQEVVLNELGKTLFKIHTIDKTSLVDSGLFPADAGTEGVKERLLVLFERALKRLPARLPQADIDHAIQMARVEIDKITAVNTMAPLHADIGYEHVFVTSDNTFSGVIDFGDAYMGHPVFDIHGVPLCDRKALLNGYFSTSDPDANFNLLLNVSYTLDSIIDVLNNRK